MCVKLRRRAGFGRIVVVGNNFSYLLTNGHLRSVRGQGTQLAEMFAQNWPTHQGRLCSFGLHVGAECRPLDMLDAGRASARAYPHPNRLRDPARTFQVPAEARALAL